MSLATVQFTANSWTTVAEGTYNFNGAGAQLFGASKAATLQVNDANPKLFRFKNFWGTGKHMTFNLTDKKGTDENGLTITQLVVPEQLLHLLMVTTEQSIMQMVSLASR